ncbi:MAG: 50S ribosomal protein L11 methyltransferase, partial [Victivallales bacterium]|nr:50S ribosomal protein L11 methyltransferase [Victivallales bacterium]
MTDMTDMTDRIDTTDMNDQTSVDEVMWCSVKITCEPGFEDIISSCIFDSGFSGLEEITKSRKTVYTAFYRRTPEINDPVDQLGKAVDDIAERNGKPAAKIGAVKDIPAEDWEVTWREGLEAIEIGESLVVRPSFVEYPNPDERVVVVLDPKMAFGTGSHETTRLCLEILEKMPVKNTSFLDIGCGSGVLAIAAAKHGVRCAIGFDYDHDSVSNASDNVRSNRVQDRVVAYEANLADVAPGRFDLVFCNMISSIIVPNLDRFHIFLQPGAHIV